ncbi:MAG: shikimate dehydrogenase [Ferruginibacter sp.]
MGELKLYGLIGYPLGHSFSKKYFTEKFKRENLSDFQYENFPLKDIDELHKLLRDFSLNGLNVTIPYKEKVIAFLDEQTETVQQIGACNCIKIENGKLTGHNTDVPAFLESIQSMILPHHKKALVLGSGGAAKAINFALDILKIDTLTVSRTSKADNSIQYKDISNALLKEYSVVINTTPVGTFPNVHECPDIPYQYLTSAHLLFDLVYNPDPSLFLQKGKEQGAAGKNGYEMLQLQADKSWEIWKGKSAGC